MSKLITPDTALKLILNETKSFGTKTVRINESLGKVLAEDIFADRDIPPFNRVTMDGIAIRYSDFQKGQREFYIYAVQGAGDAPILHLQQNQCVQIMTGSVKPDSVDTIIPIEELIVKEQTATVISTSVKRGQFIHRQGSDKKINSLLIRTGTIIDSSITPVLASVGKTKVKASKAPKMAIITSGNELVKADGTPSKFQLRQSNNIAIASVLSPYKSDFLHITDNPKLIKSTLKKCLYKYDALIISGGISKGKFDYIPKILDELSVKTIFHGVSQKPGKPLLFGKHSNGSTVFALPGNPVSTFFCANRYVRPWLNACLGTNQKKTYYARLTEEIFFNSDKTYYLQVDISASKNGELLARPLKNNGSGDYASLTDTDAFIELPAGKSTYKKNESYKLIATRPII